MFHVLNLFMRFPFYVEAVNCVYVYMYKMSEGIILFVMATLSLSTLCQSSSFQEGAFLSPVSPQSDITLLLS